MADREQLEAMQANLPPAQARWLRSKAELHGGSVSGEIKRCVHLAQMVESLIGTRAADIHYVTAQVPAGEAA